MIINTRKRNRNSRTVVSRRGAATVEFALVASAILLPMYVGLSTFSRVLMSMRSCMPLCAKVRGWRQWIEVAWCPRDRLPTRRSQAISRRS